MQAGRRHRRCGTRLIKDKKCSKIEGLEWRVLLSSVSFGSQTTYAAANDPYSVTVADLGNGHADLVTANVNSNDVSVLLGNGDGTFQAQQTYAAGSGPDYVAIADLGNGHPDVIVTNQNDNTISVLLGNGNGTFQTQQTYDTGPFPDSIAVADLGNGHPDVIVTNGSSNTVSVFMGNGDGTLQQQQTYLTSDLNSPQPDAVAVADLGNGHPDLVVTNRLENDVAVLIGKGDGTFQFPEEYATGDLPHAVAVADLGNGRQDLVVANDSGNSSDTVSVLLGNGDGTFQTQTTYSVGSGAGALAVADLGNGHPDAVVANFNSGTLSVLLGNGDGTFQTPQTLSVGTGPSSVAIANLGNGAQDLVVANSHSNNVGVLLPQSPPPPPPTTPDLQLTGVSYTAGNYSAGGTFDASGTQENTGTGAAGAYQIDAVLSLDQTFGNSDDIPLDTIDESGLAAGGSEPFSVQAVIPAGTAAGDYYLLIKIGSGNSIFSSGTANVVVGSPVPAPPVPPTPPPPPSPPSPPAVLAPDPSFGGTGSGVATVAFIARAETVDSNGRILLAGYEGDAASDTARTALERLNTDGTPDTSFGSNGVFVGAAGSGAFSSVQVDGSGRIVAAGSTGSGQFLVERFTSAGAPDMSFNGTGSVTADLGANAVAYSLAIDSGGNLVAAGTAGSKFAVVRLTSSGSLDSSFNSTGALRFNIGSDDVLSQVLIQPDGKILLAGGSGANDVIVARLNANGSFDSSFGGTPSPGMALVSSLAPTDISPGVPDASIGMALESGGTILVTNQTQDGHFGLAALNASGQTNASFGAGGLAEADFGGTDDADAISIDPSSQEILVAGTTDAGGAAQTALAEFLPTGSLDASFGSGGTLMLPLAPQASGSASNSLVRPDAFYGKDFFDQSFLAQQQNSGKSQPVVLSSGGPQTASTLRRLAPTPVLVSNSHVEVSLSGALPSSALVAGQKVRPITQRVLIGNPTNATVSGTFTIQLLLSGNTTGNSQDPVAASLTRKITLKAGKSIAVPVTIRSLPAGLSGSQHLLAEITDPNLNVAVGATSGTIGVQNPYLDIGGAFVHVPSKAKMGRSFAATLSVTESGNVTASGALPVQVSASADGLLDSGAVNLGTITRHISIQPRHRVVLQISVPLGSLPAGSYTLIAQLDPANTLSDANLANNTVFSNSPIAVS